MTPKEKAEELVNKFHPFTYTAVHAYKTSGEYADTKKCALIAVDQIILEQCKSSELKDARYQDERIHYWQQVKQEIEKL